MPIPALTSEGYLPPGIHECTLEELEERFGRFQRTDVRPRLFADLQRFVRAVKVTGFFVAIVIDGSFVSSKDAPNDVDVILVFQSGHDFHAETRPFEYNVVSRKQLRRTYGFDALYSVEASESLSEQIAFFSLVREAKESRKGLLWLDIRSNLKLVSYKPST
jgi:hypothetical protein